MKAIRSILIPMLAAGFALLVGAVLISAAGISPAAAYGKLFQGALGLDPNWTVVQPLAALISRPARLGNSLTEAIPLILAGLAVALPFRCGLLNIGAEGQIYAGGLGATFVGLYSPDLIAQVPVLHITLALIAAFAFGAVWGAIPGALRAQRGLNEIITSIMLNFMAFWSVSYLVHGPMKDPASFGYDWSREISPSAQLPIIVDRLRLNLGFVIAILAALALALVLWRTTLGFQIRTIGSGPAAARFAGIRVERGIVISMALAGGLAGLAGACVVLGVQFRLSDFFSPGYGYDAIAVAFVAQTQPVGVLFSGLLFGALRTGAEAMELSVGVPKSIATLIQALTLIFVILAQSPIIARWLDRQRTARRARTAGNAAATLPLR
jgi:ABC-type uncharacterized transport system permease subunit